MTWKKKSGSKRLAIPNLPFQNDEDDQQNQSDSSLNSSYNNNPNKTLDSSSLANAFHEQGNKLAEVSFSFYFFFIFQLKFNFFVIWVVEFKILVQK